MNHWLQRPFEASRDDRVRAVVRLLLIAAGVWLLVTFAIWSFSPPKVPLAAVSEVQDFELREVAPGDKHGTHFDGPLVRSQGRLALPAFVRADADLALHQVRFQIDLAPYLTAKDFGAPAPSDGHAPPMRRPTQSLLLTQAINGVDIYLNGVWLDGLRQSSPHSRFMWFRPMMAELPRELLHPDGPNIVTVEINSWEPYFTIAPIRIGPTSQVAYVAEAIDFICRQLADASRWFCLLAGLFMIGVWLANREDTSFGLLGAASLTWALVYTLALWVYQPSAWRPFWFWAFYLSAGALNVLMIQFVMRYIDRPVGRRPLIAIVVFSAIAATVWPFLGALVEWDLDLYWIWALMPFQLWAIAHLARHAWRTRNVHAALLLGTVVLAGTLILHDYNVLTQLVRWPAHDGDPNLVRLLGAPMYLTHLALPPLLFVMARVHLAKFRLSVEHVREANRILAESLRRREMELALSYSRQSELERREAGQDERERIYSELHDGIGSRLVTTIFSLREGRLDRGQIEHHLLDVLQGVRDLVSETDITEHRDIQDIVFEYCVGLDGLLSAPDFQVEYDIEAGRECVLLGDRSRHLMQVLEESVANTLKYARATRLTIGLHQVDRCLELTVSDDGDGLRGKAAEIETGAVRPSFGRSTGRGQAHMRERARQLGGEYRFERGPDGARTTLRLPLVGEDLVNGPGEDIRMSETENPSNAH